MEIAQSNIFKFIQPEVILTLLLCFRNLPREVIKIIFKELNTENKKICEKWIAFNWEARFCFINAHDIVCCKEDVFKSLKTMYWMRLINFIEMDITYGCRLPNEVTGIDEYYDLHYDDTYVEDTLNDIIENALGEYWRDRIAIEGRPITPTTSNDTIDDDTSDDNENEDD